MNPMPARMREATAAGEPPKLGRVIKQLRVEHGMSMTQVADKAGVSKSRLSMIERDHTNPTLATLWRLSEALGVSVSDIIGGGEAKPGIAMVPSSATPTLRSPDGRCFLRILGPVESANAVEWYQMIADPGSRLASEAHQLGAVEHLTVLSGMMTVESGAMRADVSAGATVRYPADKRHAISNPFDSRAEAILVVTFARLPARAPRRSASRK